MLSCVLLLNQQLIALLISKLQKLQRHPVRLVLTLLALRNVKFAIVTSIANMEDKRVAAKIVGVAKSVNTKESKANAKIAEVLKSVNTRESKVVAKIVEAVKSVITRESEVNVKSAKVLKSAST